MLYVTNIIRQYHAHNQTTQNASFLLPNNIILLWHYVMFSKWQNIPSCKQCGITARGLWLSDAKDKNSNKITPMGGNYIIKNGLEKNWQHLTNNLFISKMAQNKCRVSTKGD